MNTPMNDLGHAGRALLSTANKDPKARQASDPRRTAELVDLYLRDPESEEAAEAISVVQYRGGLEEFAIAAGLAGSRAASERSAAADILAQLGWQERAFHEDSVQILLRQLADPEESMIQSAAIACGHRRHVASIGPLVGLVSHPSPAVRHGVAYGLAGQDEPPAVAALITLSGDNDTHVRDWATFALASQSDLDTPPLREALRARVTDSDPEVRGEALVGLARRNDDQLKQAVLAELSGKFHGDWVLEAAELLADPALIPALEELKVRLTREDIRQYMRDGLERALQACSRSQGVSHE